jgi:hypothetical protein
VSLKKFSLIDLERRDEKAFERRPLRSQAQRLRNTELLPFSITAMVTHKVYEEPRSKGLEFRLSGSMEASLEVFLKSIDKNFFI